MSKDKVYWFDGKEYIDLCGVSSAKGNSTNYFIDLSQNEERSQQVVFKFDSPGNGESKPFVLVDGKWIAYSMEDLTQLFTNG